MRVLLDLTDTSHTTRHSGIQQVCRNLYNCWPQQSAKDIVVFDRYSKRWRCGDRREKRWMSGEFHVNEAEQKVRRWSSWQKVRGRMLKHLPVSVDPFSADTALLVPELFYPARERDFQQVKARLGGPLVAVFHDAIALRYPQHSPQSVRDNFSDYLNALAGFDAIAAVSSASRDDLMQYWEDQGVVHIPEVTVIPLGAPLDARSCFLSDSIHDNKDPVVLFVSTIEPRKNHALVLQVAERLWSEGHRFRLEFAGSVTAESGEWWTEQVALLRTKGRDCIYHGKVSAEELHDLYRRCTFTLYPSIWEGFGLPVLESLSYGKPCLCSDRGGLAEVVNDGGCWIIDPDSAESIAHGWVTLLKNEALFGKLRSEAHTRKLRDWSSYATDIQKWIHSLSPRIG